MTDRESEIYFYAFRYCLGRMTYVVWNFCHEAKGKIGGITTRWLELMDAEITEAERWDDKNPDRHFPRLGGACDREAWLKFREVIRKELEKRKE